MHRTQSCLIVAILAILGTTGVIQAEQTSRFWQLKFRYDDKSLELVQAAPVPDISKRIRTPGLAGAPVRLDYSLDWLDSGGRSLLSTPAQVPLGIRVIMNENEPCRELIPDSGFVLIRVEGPAPRANPSAVRLSRSAQPLKSSVGQALPPPFEAETTTLTLPPYVKSTALDGPTSAEKIRDTGPDFNRLVIVIMGDGYTSANLLAGEFESDAGSLKTAFYQKSPWDVLFAATNVYRVDIESNEEGADNEVYGVYKDTYLNSSFWVSGIERLLSLTGDGFMKATDAADAMVGVGVWDVILVLVNSTKYGGSGGGIAISSVHPAADEIVLHELGHSFADLADEYEDAYPGYPPGDYEPNVDYDYSGPGLKWLVWVDPGTPLPTPEDISYWGVVGAFEGARYLSSGIYRPFYECQMRSLGVEFCPICKEAHVLNFAHLLNFADWVDPYPSSVVDVTDAGTEFSITPIPFTGLTYEWLLDGEPLAGQSGPQITLTAEDMSATTQDLEAVITFDTPLVRKSVMTDSYSWTLNRVSSSCCVGIVGDVNNSGEYEPTIGDISALIDHLFIGLQPLPCWAEADANQSGGSNPGPEDISIGDISTLIDHLFISLNPLPACP